MKKKNENKKRTIIIIVISIVAAILIILALINGFNLNPNIKINIGNNTHEELITLDYKVDNISLSSYIYHNDNKDEKRTVIHFNIYSMLDKRDKLPLETIIYFKCHNKDTNELETYFTKNTTRFNVLHEYSGDSTKATNQAELTYSTGNIDYCNFLGLDIYYTYKNEE